MSFVLLVEPVGQCVSLLWEDVEARGIDMIRAALGCQSYAYLSPSDDNASRYVAIVGVPAFSVDDEAAGRFPDNPVAARLLVTLGIRTRHLTPIKGPVLVVNENLGALDDAKLALAYQTYRGIVQQGQP